MYGLVLSGVKSFSSTLAAAQGMIEELFLLLPGLSGAGQQGWDETKCGDVEM